VPLWATLVHLRVCPLQAQDVPSLYLQSINDALQVLQKGKSHPQRQSHTRHITAQVGIPFVFSHERECQWSNANIKDPDQIIFLVVHLRPHSLGAAVCAIDKPCSTGIPTTRLFRTNSIFPSAFFSDIPSTTHNSTLQNFLLHNRGASRLLFPSLYFLGRPFISSIPAQKEDILD